MKKLVIVIAVVVAMLLTAISAAAYGMGNIDADQDISLKDALAVDDYGIAPASFFPFISQGENESDYLKEFLGPNNCVADYLYVKNTETNEIIQIMDEPVEVFTDTNDFLFCITKNMEVVRTDYSGDMREVLYSAENEKLSDITYYNGDLYFIADNTAVQMLDLSSKTVTTLTEMEDVVVVLPFHGNRILLESRDEESFVFDRTTGTTAPVPEESVMDLLATDPGNLEIQSATILSDSATSSSFNDVTFPLETYPVGSYFTYDGSACDHDNDGAANCRRYAFANQCMGFAMYASDKFAHIPERGNSAYTRTKPDWSGTSLRYVAFASTADVQAYFAGLTPGAYVRLSREDADGDTNKDGSHSLVYVSSTDTGVWVYDCNRDDQCGVDLKHFTFEAIKRNYVHKFEHVSHQYTTSAQYMSPTHHKIKCANCEGYVARRHSPALLDQYQLQSNDPLALYCAVCQSYYQPQ